MRSETGKWVEKAEGDIFTARRELAVKEYPNYDAACFHAQQCVEKYLKGYLVEAGCSFPKIHDLIKLLDLILPFEPSWEYLQEGLNNLTSLGVEIRYPGMNADHSDADEAVQTAEQVRAVVRQNLRLE